MTSSTLRSHSAHRQVDFGPHQIEKVFLSVVLDLSVPVILDVVEETPTGYAIRSHDLCGPLVTVSYNWSASAEDNNFEHAVFVIEAPVIQSFVADFNRLWSW